MRLTKILLWVSLGVAVIALVVGFSVKGYWFSSIAMIALLLLWGIGRYYGLQWGISLSLVGFVMISATGFWLEVAPGWIVLGLIAGLVAWDLHDFTCRMGSAQRIEAEEKIERLHLRRLGIIVSSGLILVSIALLAKVHITFGVALLLSLGTILGLRQGIITSRSLGK